MNLHRFTRPAAGLVSGLVLTAAVTLLTGCGQRLYPVPQYNYTGRPIPPSHLLNRVLASYNGSGFSGGLQMLDAKNDLRRNIQNTILSFPISGYSAVEPTTIISFPEETRGYVLSQTDGVLGAVNYGTEASSGSVATFGANPAAAAASPDGAIFLGANESTGQLILSFNGGTYVFTLPGVYRTSINTGDSVLLAMVRNSNTLYRVVKLPATSNPIVPPGAVDCEPILLPTFCVVPVAGTYDRPLNVIYSNDGSSAYVLNCGAECGGNTASVTFLQLGPLNINNVPTVNPLSVGAPSPLVVLPVANPVPIPGGATMAVSDGTYLYLSGQSLFRLNGSGVLGSTPAADGLFTGYVTRLSLTTYVPDQPLSISDGTHTRMLLADDNTLWIGSSQCASGERAAVAAAQIAAHQSTTQAGNYNCLTMVTLPATAGGSLTAKVVPVVVQSATAPVPVQYPNSDQNQFYYGSLTGLCWVQNLHKMYTAYGGQIHAFNTADGSERDNTDITIQGTVFDVAYMDALTNGAN